MDLTKQVDEMNQGDLQEGRGGAIDDAGDDVAASAECTSTSSSNSSKRKQNSMNNSFQNTNEPELQGSCNSKRRRRYQRRGSKVSTMLFALPYDFFATASAAEQDETRDDHEQCLSSSYLSSTTTAGSTTATLSSSNNVVNRLIQPHMKSRRELLTHLALVEGISSSLSSLSTTHSDVTCDESASDEP